MNWRFFHILVLVVSLMALGFAFALKLDDVGWHFFGLKWPLHCIFQHEIGGHCAFCGIMRAFAAAAHGNFERAVRFNLLGVMLFGFVAFQLPYRIYAIMKHPRKVNLLIRKLNGLLMAAVLLTAFVQWVFSLASDINNI